MKKAALLAAVAAGVAAGAALGVFVPRWLAPAATPVAAAAPAKPVSKPAPVRVEVSAVAEIPFARGLSAVGSLRSVSYTHLFCRPSTVTRSVRGYSL